MHIINTDPKMKTKRIITDQKGAALIEFAIVLIVLVLLAIGASEFGLILYNKQVITNASREGARAGISRLTETQIKTVVTLYCNTNNRLLPPGTLLSDTDVTVSGGGQFAAFQSDLTVTVNFAHNYMFAGVVGLGPKPLYAQTVMKMEPDPPPSP